MFRKMRRFKQQICEGKCIQLLEEQPRGILSMIGDDGYPYGVPINHYFDPSDSKIYFHGGKTGHKIDALKRSDKVSFCVVDEGTKDPDSWYLHFRSVIVFGRIEWVTDREKTAEKARELSYRFTEDDTYIDEEIRKSLDGTLMFALVPEYISGKHIREK